MTRVLLGEAFAFEYVAEMAAAVRADYLNATSVGVAMPLDAARVFVIEAGPAAARLKLSLRRVERVVAAPANKRAGRKQRLVLAAEWPFRSLVYDHSLFVG